MSLTIYFNGQFWCGAVEFYNEFNQWVVMEYVFGSEPKIEDIFYFINAILPHMLDSKWLANTAKSDLTYNEQKYISPKRRQRMLNKEKSKKGLSTKSQDALKLQLEAKKEANKKCRKKNYELEKQKKFVKKQEKKREKHKGH